MEFLKPCAAIHTMDLQPWCACLVVSSILAVGHVCLLADLRNDYTFAVAALFVFLKGKVRRSKRFYMMFAVSMIVLALVFPLLFGGKILSSLIYLVVFVL